MANSTDQIIGNSNQNLDIELINKELNIPGASGQDPAVNLEGFIDNYTNRANNILEYVDGTTQSSDQLRQLIG